MSVKFIYWYWIYSANNLGDIYQLEGVCAPPKVRGPICRLINEGPNLPWLNHIGSYIMVDKYHFLEFSCPFTRYSRHSNAEYIHRLYAIHVVWFLMINGNNSTYLLLVWPQNNGFPARGGNLSLNKAECLSMEHSGHSGQRFATSDASLSELYLTPLSSQYLPSCE